MEPLIPTECQGMNNSEELPDIVRAMNRAKMKNPIARCQINSLIFHRARISRTSRIHRPSVCPYLQRQWKYGIMTICGGINEFCHQLSYMRSGTSIPNSPIAFLMIFATFLASTRRKSFFCSSGSLRML